MMSIEKEELKELKEEMADYREDLQELHELKTEAKGLAHIDDIKVSKGANRLYIKVNKLISKLDTILSDLEKSEKRMKKEMDTLSNQQKSESLVAAELIRIDELILAIKHVQNVPDNHRLARITEILGEIDDDGDGAIRIEDVLKVVGLISKEDIKLSKTQLNEFIKLLEKEEVLEVEEQIHKALEKESSSAAHFQSNKIVGSTADVLNGNKKKVLSQVTPNDIKLTNNVNTKPGKPVLTENKNSTDLSHSRRSELVPESTLPSNVSSSTKKLKGSKQL
ncbi:mitochondrial proton/calcium exchanger protein [Copidosoma floridanum]|uniref:mitochondrial proton/calcium exchanger protein n=1 Tax=Copidosoma floridanum TaxID=29053 RepID=UPI0006C9A5E8|nr:mitochondrial proton/calcium exchanger protein [Copidosoma floridanum]